MSIKKSSEDLLKFIYENRKGRLSSISLSDKLTKEMSEINEYLDYLKGKGLMELESQTMDGNYHYMKLTSEGIDFVEEALEKDTSFVNSIQKSIVEENIKEEEIKYDFFISHASEDKEDFVDELARELKELGLTVWYDNFDMDWGNDLRPNIDEGLKKCKYGIVILSRAFLDKKKWTEYELNSLFARETTDKRVILPIWHNINREDVLRYSPILADRIALKSNNKKEILDKCSSLFGKNFKKKDNSQNEEDEIKKILGGKSEAGQPIPYGTTPEEKLESIKGYGGQVANKIKKRLKKEIISSKDNPEKEHQNFVEIFDELTYSDMLSTPRFKKDTAKKIAGIFCKEKNYPKFLTFLKIFDELTYSDILSTPRFSEKEALDMAFKRIGISFDGLDKE